MTTRQRRKSKSSWGFKCRYNSSTVYTVACQVVFCAFGCEAVRLAATLLARTNLGHYCQNLNPLLVKLLIMARFKIVLVNPEIPGNTGSIGRTCVALDLELILIRPYGFDLDEKSVRRAGLDYWKHVNIKEYDSFQDYLSFEKPPLEKLFFYSRFVERPYFQASFTENCHMVFGAETKGLPRELFERYPQNFYVLPMNSKHIRSLNLANAVTAVAYEGIRQLDFN